MIINKDKKDREEILCQMEKVQYSFQMKIQMKVQMKIQMKFLTKSQIKICLQIRIPYPS